MINIASQGGRTTPYLKEFIVDYISDIDKLPTDDPVGSTAFCIENSSAYILGGDRKWKEI